MCQESVARTPKTSSTPRMGLAVTKQEAFWEACGYGHTDRVKAFIEEGVDVNWISYTHNCCAIHVASQGKPAIVSLLLEANCNVNAKDDRGNLALHHAAMKGEAEIMQQLITAGSQIDTPDKNGWTSLINAAYWCQPEAVRVLLKNRACPHLENKDDRTALHETCRSQSTHEEELAEIAEQLLQAGCDINAKSSDLGWADFTPLMFASYWGHHEVAKVLLKHTCDINAQGSNGWTALHWAANTDHADIIETLLEAGLDPNIPGYRGEYGMDVTKNDEIRDRLGKVTIKKETYKPVEKAWPVSSRTSNGDSNVRADNINQNQSSEARIESQKNEQIMLRRDLHKKLLFRQDKRRKQIMRQGEDPNTVHHNDDEIKAMDDDDDDEDTSVSTMSSATKTENENGNVTPGSASSDTELDNSQERERIPYFFEEELEKVLALPDPEEDKRQEEKEKRFSMYKQLSTQKN